MLHSDSIGLTRCRALVGLTIRHATYLTCLAVASVLTSPVLAFAGDSCNERYDVLYAKYTQLYAALSNDCFPTNLTEAEATTFELSAECTKKYNSLGDDFNVEWSALLAECQDVLFPATADPSPAPQPTEVPATPQQPSSDSWDPTAVNKNCSERFSALSDKYSAAYINLDAECGPGDGASWCGFEISPECNERYSALSDENNEEYNALLQDCNSGEFAYITSVNGSSDLSTSAVRSESRLKTPRVVAAPSKKELLAQIKSLKKQLRRAKASAKASAKKMRARCRR
jgi:hypothetical protein